jgi:nitrite reductase/ring-hydroxylating ferredoxin subunit
MDVAETVNRRDFVVEAAAAGVGLVVLAGACASAPAARGAEQPASGGIDAGSVTEFKRPGVYDKLAATKKILLVRNGERLVAVSAICTHKACTVKCPGGGGGGGGELKCSCHGSLFTPEGEVKKGPAQVPLPHLGIATNDAGRVIIDPSQRFAHDKWGDPKSFVKLS